MIPMKMKSSLSCPVRARAFLLAAVAALLLAPPIRGQGEPSTGEIREALNSPDSEIRHAMWKRLNPEKSNHYKVLIQILGKLAWHDRDGAIVALSKAATEKAIEKIVKELHKNRNPFVRQGIAQALALMNDEKYYKELYTALDDKNPYVRRVVVDALKVHKKESAVEALIKRFQVEKDPVVNTFIENSLNELTQAFRGPNPLAWLIWWNEAKNDPDYKLGETDEDAKRAAEELGRKLKERTTVLAGVELTTAERGSGDGVPILVIPHYGYSKKTMLPFLSELEKNHKLYYIDLPPISSFKGLKAVGATKMPYYPIDKLVEAFEELRKKTNQKHFAIMTCGMNGWIAMRYARLYPESIAGMILISPISSGKQFGKATELMIRTGKKDKDRELWHYALTRQINAQTGEDFHERHHRENQEAKPAGEEAALARRSWSLMFGEERDSAISMLFADRMQPLGGVIIPDFMLFREPKPSIIVPTMVIVGKKSLHTTIDDAKQIADHFKGLFFVYQHSASMPFAEESTRFNNEVTAFLAKYGRPEKKGKEERGAKEAN